MGKHIGFGTLVALARKNGYTGHVRQTATVPVIESGGVGGTTLVERSLPIAQTLNDDGNAKRLFRAASGKVRYDRARERWMWWNSYRWLPDQHGRILTWAAEVLRGIYGEAREIDDPEMAKRVGAHASKSLDHRRIVAALELFRAVPGVSFEPGEADADPFALQTSDGTHVSLREGAARPATPDDLLIRAAGCGYSADADCPLWHRTLLEIFEGSAEKVAFMQRLAGYSATGDMREQHFIFMHGHGANGKSLMLNVIRDVLGTYAMQAPASMYIAARPGAGEGATPMLARLPGVRLAISNEVGEGARLDEGVVKALTGGDPIIARELYGRPFECRPVAKHWMAGNHRPTVVGDDHGIWRRLILVHFRRQFNGSERDPELATKLRAEYPGILNWIIEGAREWLRQGLNPPASILAETASYRSDMDLLGQWLEEGTELKAEATTGARDAYTRFAYWCQSGGHIAIAERRFADKMAARGFTKSRTNKGVIYSGLRLK